MSDGLRLAVERVRSVLGSGLFKRFRQRCQRTPVLVAVLATLVGVQCANSLIEIATLERQYSDARSREAVAIGRSLVSQLTPSLTGAMTPELATRFTRMLTPSGVAPERSADVAVIAPDGQILSRTLRASSRHDIAAALGSVALDRETVQRNERFGETVHAIIPIAAADGRIVAALWVGLDAKAADTTLSVFMSASGLTTALLTVSAVIVLMLLGDRSGSQETPPQPVHRDALTGLPSRQYLLSHVSHRLSQADSRTRRFAVMLLDLDRFKYINSSFGHATGDALLVQVAERLRKRLRDHDVIARLGGDEFVIVVDNVCTESVAMQLAASIIDTLTRPLELEGHALVVTTSVGIALSTTHGSDAEDLLKHADAAMYHAKSTGRNCCPLYSRELTLRSQHRLSIESGLRRALENAELELHYQPRVAMRTGKLRSVEALLRWRHPQRGLLLPGEFLDVAQETDLIVEIGTWVLREACRAAAHWRFELGAPISVSVNVAERQMTSDHLVHSVSESLAEFDLPASALELEVSEECMMVDAAGAATILNELHDLGVRVAVDDFGTGYSSLNRLKQLRLHGLKVDGSFVKDLPTDEECAAIAVSIVTLGHSLGLYVVGEGVETQQQAAFLRTLGCDEGQGYYFARPLPEAELLRHSLFLASRQSVISLPRAEAS